MLVVSHFGGLHIGKISLAANKSAIRRGGYARIEESDIMSGLSIADCRTDTRFVTGASNSRSTARSLGHADCVAVLHKNSRSSLHNLRLSISYVRICTRYN